MTPTEWQPSATLDILKQRAKVLRQIRDFFNARGYLEVETPVMGRFGVTDCHLKNIEASFRGQSYCLQTSPEYHMKRLLAAGSGPIFQLARVFRDDELGRWHNPEFTMLEWYQLGIDHHALMDEMDDLLQGLLGTPPLIRKTYQSAFISACSIDPLHATDEELKTCVADFGLGYVFEEGVVERDDYLHLLMSHVVEPFFSKEAAPVALYHFPASQASLAKVKDGVAERFEIYYQGVELANGFHELVEKNVQKARFETDLIGRRERGLPEPAMDSYLLDALESGLPPCSGVALGVDRLLALALKQATISAVWSFDFSRA